MLGSVLQQQAPQVLQTDKLNQVLEVMRNLYIIISNLLDQYLILGDKGKQRCCAQVIITTLERPSLLTLLTQHAGCVIGKGLNIRAISTELDRLIGMPSFNYFNPVAQNIDNFKLCAVISTIKAYALLQYSLLKDIIANKKSY